MADTRTITIHLTPEHDDEIRGFAASMGRDVSNIAKELLLEWLEDQEDIRDAEVAIASGEPTRSLQEVMNDLGLEG